MGLYKWRTDEGGGTQKYSAEWLSNASNVARTSSGWRRNLVCRDKPYNKPYIGGTMSSSGPRMVRNRRPKSHVNQGSRPRAAGLASWHLRPHPGRNVAAEQPVGLRLPADFKIPHSQRFEFEYEKAQLLKILEAGWERENCGCLEAASTARQDDAQGVEQAFADSRGLST